MNPIHFKEETAVYAKGQPQYRPLPTCEMPENPDDPQSVIRYTCKYELSDLEMQQIMKTKCLYINQFGYVLQPIYPQIDSPFLVLPVEFKFVGNRCYDFYIPLQNGEQIILKNIQLELTIDTVMKETGLQPDQFHFKERPSMSIDENGIINGI